MSLDVPQDLPVRPKTRVAWSSGKDSAWTLHVLRTRGVVEVNGLLTTVNRTANRVAVHAVREELLEAQARATGLPLAKGFIPSPCSNVEYERAMLQAVASAREQGVTHIAFGDLFLEDVRRYREAMLAGSGMTPLFPLWGLDTRQLARTMIQAEVRAVLTCVDPARLAPAFAGRTYDHLLLSELPPAVDPCGERGEFHTFAYTGPMFANSLSVTAGEVVTRDGFVYADAVSDD